MASISLSLAGKGPQEGFQKEEVEQGTLRSALPQAPVESNARCGAMPGDDAHQRPTAEGVEEPDELLWDPMWRRGSASAPCGAVSNALETSKART